MRTSLRLTHTLASAVASASAGLRSHLAMQAARCV
jgi:hypothetical protein